ncbi:hypothetical protein CVT24_010009 [Panaeolus cyanescens]|uniref:NAD(P)-binding domain-containing protein n=1 Tax=Panaeolus cyanescens TaxID=181874 RepID=A0A409VY82_9AGAR|nr:hypothetical protein CVT24_010009 [Panaeolus cyanescens]
MTKTRFFLTGATGYIGGSVLTRLLSHPQADTFHITVLVRDPSKISQFKRFGINPVQGSNANLALLREQAANTDLVIACADADDEDAAKAILQGLKDHHKKTGRTPSLIHTSGTGVLSDNAQGRFAADRIYSDLNIPQLESLPKTQPHRVVDLSLVEADKEGYVKTYIILPCTIYGIAKGCLVDAGLQNPHSQQIPTLVRLSVDRRRAGMVGEGKNVWNNVHIDEVADLYILLVDLIISGSVYSIAPKHFEHGVAGFYFAENGEHTLRSIGDAIGKVLVSKGITSNATPTTFTEEEHKRYFPNGTSLGTNSRCHADRARSIGWKPRKTTQDMLASVKDEF